MPHMSEASRELWLYMFHDGGAYTARELAAELERDVDGVFDALQSMAKQGTIEKRPGFAMGEKGRPRLRYCVTGTCKVPIGMAVAEVQV